MKKQFRYALGEIFIVIVGTSIAFSLGKFGDIMLDRGKKLRI